MKYIVQFLAYGLGDDMPLSLDAPGALAFSDIICGSLDGKLMKDNKNDLAVSNKYSFNMVHGSLLI